MNICDHPDELLSALYDGEPLQANLPSTWTSARIAAHACAIIRT
jgi:hypothetical protein